jgi:hypothetical protein
MGRTTIAIICGAGFLTYASGCSSAAAVPTDAAVADHSAASPDAELDGEGDGTSSAEMDATPVSASAACAAAGGVCNSTNTCVVVGPVHCGSGALCCMAASTGGNPNTPDDATTGGCASGSCAEDAGTAAPDAPATG